MTDGLRGGAAHRQREEMGRSCVGLFLAAYALELRRGLRLGHEYPVPLSRLVHRSSPFTLVLS
jgi:hypothetical protein